MADKHILVVAITSGRDHSYYLSQSKADILVARGHARPATDGTRRVFLCYVNHTGTGRVWRKVTNRTKYGASLYSSMQLVEPGRSRPAR